MGNDMRTSDELMLTLYHLTGMDGDGLMRTQAAVAKALNKSSTTISKHCRKLERLGAVARVNSAHSYIVYRRGPKFGMYRDHAMAVGQGRKRPPELAWATHLSGFMAMFEAETVGSTETVRVKRGVEIQLFGKNEGYRIKGSHNLTAKPFTFGKDINRRYELRLQTSSKCNLLYVAPCADVVVSGADASDEEKCLDAIVAACAPLLDLLERNGWVFKKCESGGYALHNRQKILRQCEAGHGPIHRAARGPDAEALVDCVGDFGVSDGTPVWTDRSDGPRELETGDPSYVEAITSLPQVYKYLNESQNHLAAQDGLSRKILERIEALQEEVGAISQTSEKNYAILSAFTEALASVSKPKKTEEDDG